MYTIGELADRAGVNIQTIRYYERIDLLPEVERDVNGYRAYKEIHVKLVEHIFFAKSLGFTLAEIREYLDKARLCNFSDDKILEVLERKQSEISEEIELLQTRSQIISDKIKQVKKSINRAEDCEIKNVISEIT